MTFQEYINKNGKERVPRGSVHLRVKDCWHIQNIERKRKLITINYDGVLFTYLKFEESSLLWTTDRDGNAKTPSVFRIHISSI